MGINLAKCYDPGPGKGRWLLGQKKNKGVVRNIIRERGEN